MKGINCSKLRECMSGMLDGIQFDDEKFIVKRHGEPIAVMMSYREYQAMEDDVDLVVSSVYETIR